MYKDTLSNLLNYSKNIPKLDAEYFKIRCKIVLENINFRPVMMQRDPRISSKMQDNSIDTFLVDRKRNRIKRNTHNIL